MVTTESFFKLDRLYGTNKSLLENFFLVSTVNRPKNFLMKEGIHIGVDWRTVAPDPLTILQPYRLNIIDWVEYEKRYRTQLDRKSSDVIYQWNEEIVPAAEGRCIVLLHWEHKEPVLCHMNILMAWFVEQGMLENIS